jgi:hypothetical protein
MYTNGLLKLTDQVFAPFKGRKRLRDRKCIRPLYPLDHKNVSVEHTLELILRAIGKNIL